MTDAVRGPRPRPLSPHVQVWRWHVTMLGSILHRISGVGLYAGALILAAWAVCLASGPEAYGAFKAAMGSIPGKAVLFALTAGLVYHLVNGVRHLAWDTGAGFEVKTANATGWAVLAITVVGTLSIWGVAAAMGVL